MLGIRNPRPQTGRHRQYQGAIAAAQTFCVSLFISPLLLFPTSSLVHYYSPFNTLLPGISIPLTSFTTQSSSSVFFIISIYPSFLFLISCLIPPEAIDDLVGSIMSAASSDLQVQLFKNWFKPVSRLQQQLTFEAWP